ncbi:hypothetical protein D3C76_928430 [compost metagenome]
MSRIAAVIRKIVGKLSDLGILKLHSIRMIYVSLLFSSMQKNIIFMYEQHTFFLFLRDRMVLALQKGKGVY